MEKYYVNTSSTFLSKNRCIKCNKFPKNYFAYRPLKLYIDNAQLIKMQLLVQNYYKSNRQYFWIIDPKSIRYIGSLFHLCSYKGRNIKFFKNKGESPLVECVICECGGSIWAFSNKSNAKKPEILHRKSRLKYPHSFTFM